MAKIVYSYMIPVYVLYALLVKAGKWAISEDDNPDSLPVVPELYQEKVATYLAQQAEL